MADQILIADSGVPQCLSQLDPSLTRGANFGGQLGVTDAYTNVRWFGAVGDGVTDDAPAIRQAVAYALANDRTLWFPPGDYGIGSVDPLSADAGVYIGSSEGVGVQMDAMATLKVLPSFDAALPTSIGKMVRIDNNGSYTAGRVVWEGGKFDISAAPSANPGIDGLSIGPKYRSVIVRDVIFFHGEGVPSGSDFPGGNGDTSLAVKESEHLEITGCVFVGARDLGIYLNGDFNTSRDGRHATISGNHFVRCENAAATKRGFNKLTFIGNHIYECGGGFFAGVADGINDPTGSSLLITSNTFTKTQGNPIRLTNTKNAVIANNEVVDWRRLVSDGVTETGVSNGNIGGAINMEGCTRVAITGNTIGFRDWAPVYTNNKFVTGVSMRDTTQTSGVGCSDIMITGNTVHNVESPFYASNTCSRITIFGNEVNDVIAASRLGTGANMLGQHKVTAAASIAGYIEVRDADGVVRKLATLS